MPVTTQTKRSATAVWSGSLKEGNGNLSAPSGILHSTQYSFGSRFESSPGVSPDELIAAALAGCYAMAVSAALGEAGFEPHRLEVSAEVILEEVSPAGWTITSSHLTLSAKVPLITPDKFASIVEQAKACTISRALNVAQTLEAKLV
jgi:lipoyl-dependent peroxiredoxin